MPSQLSPREAARRATNVAFANRVCGMAPPGEVPATDFDVEYVVSSVALPESAALHDHMRAWKTLGVKFNEEWAKRPYEEVA